MTDLIIFAIVFAIQILLLSVYFPVKLIKRMNWVQTNYPESTHPKLYPKSINFYQKMVKFYSVLNGLMFILGLVVLYYLFKGSLMDEKGVHPMLPWVYFMLQMIPYGVIEMYGFKMSKLMKQQDSRTKKSAKLAPRNIFQYISPQLFSLVIFSFVVFIFAVFYMDDFVFEWGGKAFILSLALLISYAFFITLSCWLIYGKKCDPYQSQADRIKAVSVVIKTYCYTAMASAFFLAFSAMVSTYDLKALMPVGMSLFLQFIVVISTGFTMQKIQLEDIDFDVYKAETLTGEML